ncbi:hypothetical protein D4L84_08315 [Campylobacter coli]|nr:hypothetical protein D4L84_08315 [Campylobacter coli]
MKLKDFDFRIWDKHHKGCGNKDCKCQTKYVYGEEAKTRLSEFKEDCEIELFTGLYDKKGKKVYENDIVKVKSLYDYFLAKISIHKEGTFYFKGKNGDYIGSLIYLVEDEGYTIEAIGNIHENAELLKVKDDEAEENDIFFKGNMIVWLFGNYYSVYEVVKAYEESYIISDLMGRQIEIDPRVAMNGGYKDAKDDLFLWYFEVMENEEIKIYPKKLTYNQMLEECKKNDIYIIKPLYSLGYTYNNNREDFKNYN